MQRKKHFSMTALFIVVMMVLGSGNAAAQVRVTIQNNITNRIGVIEVKLSSSTPASRAPIWTVFHYGGEDILSGGSSVITLPAAGTYDIRVRWSNWLMISDSSRFYVKKNVRVTNGMTVTFTNDNAYTLTRTDYQEVLQDICKFSSPANVWTAINKHPRADVVYRIWVYSYDRGEADGVRRTGKPANKTDQQIVFERLAQFGLSRTDSDNLLTAIRTHNSPTDLLRAWADSYYGLR